jgi:hypothetical protein
VRKIRESDSARGKMSDYEPAARKISAYAIKLYTGRVSTEDGYPDKMTELVWAKQAWNEACEHMGISMAYNHEIIKLVCHEIDVLAVADMCIRFLTTLLICVES